jgi:branched-chain amino acid transport system substrate-binding protein
MSNLRVRIRAIGLCLTSLALMLGTAVSWAQGVTANTVRLGQSAALSGPAAALGTDMQTGAKLFFDKLNAQGGVNGRNIELITLDDGYEPPRAAANTKTLLEERDVFALFGYVGTPTSAASLPLATAAKVPFFAPFTGAAILREPFNRYAIHIRAGYNEETAKIVKQFTTLGLKRIAVFYQNDSYGLAGLNGVLKAMEPLQLKPTATATVERNSVDVAKSVKALMESKPDVIIQVSAYASCAAFIKEARKAGYGGQFFNVSFVGTQALAKALGDDGHGIAVTQVMPFLYSQSAGVMEEYNVALKAAGLQPTYGTLEGYVAAKVLAEGLRRAGRDITRDKFINAIESIRNWNLGAININFGPNDHVGSDFVEMTMLDNKGRVFR